MGICNLSWAFKKCIFSQWARKFLPLSWLNCIKKFYGPLFLSIMHLLFKFALIFPRIYIFFYLCVLQTTRTGSGSTPTWDLWRWVSVGKRSPLQSTRPQLVSSSSSTGFRQGDCYQSTPPPPLPPRHSTLFSGPPPPDSCPTPCLRCPALPPPSINPFPGI